MTQPLIATKPTFIPIVVSPLYRRIYTVTNYQQIYWKSLGVKFGILAPITALYFIWNAMIFFSKRGDLGNRAVYFLASRKWKTAVGLMAFLFLITTIGGKIILKGIRKREENERKEKELWKMRHQQEAPEILEILNWEISQEESNGGAPSERVVFIESLKEDLKDPDKWLSVYMRLHHYDRKQREQRVIG